MAVTDWAVAENRTIDGSGNNLANPTFGQAGTQLLRMAPAAYPDGAGSLIVEFPTRANPREISDTIAAQGAVNVFNTRGMSDFIWIWGQFLDHDIDLTGNSAANGVANIAVPTGDVWFDPASTGTAVIPLNRSNFDAATGTSAANPRQQVNQITAYIDASNVYGSDTATANSLRTFSGGLLDSRLIGGETLLPDDGMGSVRAGDVRAAEQVGLTAMHTLFLREHNRLANLLAVQRPTATDEELYQAARKIVGAELQSITYNEFLPALLGAAAPRAEDFDYDATLNAQINNEFSTALYRVGHTMLAGNLALVDDNGVPVGQLALRDAFFNPSFLETPGAIDLLLKGFATQSAQQIDTLVVDDVRNFLFGAPGSGGLDLSSLNIQRGRDHGLADYNTLRVAYGLAPVDSFDDITSDPALAADLASLYGTVDNIDPWAGALAEDHLPGAGVGELIAAALVDQFTRLRDGDRFFYLNDPELWTAETFAIIGDIGALRLSDVILFNTNITQLQS
ncbi:MAG: peroxidase family protein, partial [Planctomycetales bacterium]|nr:peroxidase family protein [Planctomycetales bacterium]